MSRVTAGIVASSLHSWLKHSFVSSSCPLGFADGYIFGTRRPPDRRSLVRRPNCATHPVWVLTGLSYFCPRLPVLNGPSQNSPQRFSDLLKPPERQIRSKKFLLAQRHTNCRPNKSKNARQFTFFHPDNFLRKQKSPPGSPQEDRQHQIGHNNSLGAYSRQQIKIYKLLLFRLFYQKLEHTIHSVCPSTAASKFKVTSNCHREAPRLKNYSLLPKTNHTFRNCCFSVL